MSNTLKANQWLRRFRVDITSSSNRVFANGRQQVEVTITIEPRDGETISEESLASMQLIAIDDDGKILDLDGDLLAQSERDERYVYHGAYGNAHSALPEASPNSIRRRFYVSSKLPGGTLSTIYAGIWKDENTSFETNTAPFSSSVVIESIAPRRLQQQDFQLALESRYEYTISGESRYDDEYKEDVAYFGTQDSNNPIVQSFAVGPASGVPFYQRRNWDHALISFELVNDYSQRCDVTAYGVDADVTLTFNGDKTFYPRAHHMMLHRSHRRFYERYHNYKAVQRSLWTVIDSNGNEHGIEFRTSDNGEDFSFRVN
ncbi:hypothetical protein KSS93_08425 [Pseudomonas xanthosomatis]|uniref:hypothetical protein n=1 Tax=Pseudomonas xanthosomatis TaxID=2842356 RepID=UPI001C3C8DEB|nr:hypothetical protein [Pseudomonas xanthosomatis]QXH47916.1 hypothetical protein KSS93_08425 [Pseudomonas xanthosomatis]